MTDGGFQKSTLTVSLSGCNRRYVKTKCCCITYVSFEVIFCEYFFDPFRRRPDERRRVKVVDLVEVEECRQVGEHLVAYLIPRLVALLDLVDDVVRDLVVLPAAGNDKTVLKALTMMMKMGGKKNTSTAQPQVPPGHPS